MNQRQSGHALLIVIIVVLAVAILGVLGFLFWQNIQKPGNSSNVTSFEECKAAPGSKLQLTYPEQCITADGQSFTGPGDAGSVTKTKELCTEAELLCFTYEEGWKIDELPRQSSEVGSMTDDLRISSPDGKFGLILNTGISGLGGTCPEDARKNVYVLKPTAIPGLTGYKDEYNNNDAVVSRTVYQNDDGTYIAALYVTTQPEYSKEGTLLTCSIGFSQFFTGKNSKISSDYPNAGAIRFGYTGSEYYGETIATYDSVESAKAVYETENYKQAAKILASARYQ